MRCFYHPEIEAVGTCKHCARGLCHACATERAGGLACTGRCEAEVDAVTRLVQRNVQAMGASPWPIALRVLIYWGICAGMIYLGATQPDPTLRFVALALAALTFIAGLGSARLLMRSGLGKPG